MEGIGLINVVRKTRIEKPYSKGAKIFFTDPVIYSVLEGEKAKFREAFVVFDLKRKGEVLAEKNETKSDLIFNNIRLEIAGSSKKPKEADYVIRDDVDPPVRNAIPMWTFTMEL